MKTAIFVVVAIAALGAVGIMIVTPHSLAKVKIIYTDEALGRL
jgi:hypothetical protein